MVVRKAMLVRKCGGLLRSCLLPPCAVQTRSWSQVGHVISTPPRVPVSFGEKMVHAAFMLFVWLTPIAYFLSSIKVWRLEYQGN